MQIVFDIDGTLCDTRGVDEECFLRACGEALGASVELVDWQDAPHVTDAGLLEWLWSKHRGRAPTLSESQAVEYRFLELLREALAATPERFRAIPGASSMMSSGALSGCDITAATGGWRASARLKLAAAGLPVSLLGASSSDSPDRVEVFRLAVCRSRTVHRSGGPVVLVGDGVWDVHVARELEWRFVGIASAQRAERLRRAGAHGIVPDFRDAAAFREAIATSRVPSSRSG